ncbi:MAG: hypothetical protein CEE38_18835 [Planctomycetes bacterium B3_Pla]|nr:MAG: hypothetical protein CEE38_18835 [Planctomycetes bacterium B3_Pla]
MYEYITGSCTEMQDAFKELLSDCSKYRASTILGVDFDLILFFASEVSILYFTRYARSSAAAERSDKSDVPSQACPSEKLCQAEPPRLRGLEEALQASSSRHDGGTAVAAGTRKVIYSCILCVANPK